MRYGREKRFDELPIYIYIPPSTQSVPLLAHFAQCFSTKHPTLEYRLIWK